MRLIDAEPIEKFIEDGLNNPDKLKAFGHDAIEVLTEIHFAPTIDPASLRPKGEWIMKETMIRSPFAKNVYCSECLEEASFAHNFCPNCGADMRGNPNDS